MASFNDSAGRLKIYAKLFLTGKHKSSLGQKAHRVSPICLSKELGRLKKKKKNAWVSNESSRFAYRVFTGPFSYFKHE